MSLKQYGVLKCKVIKSQPGTESNPHYQVQVSDNQINYRIAINVKSQENPSEVLYFLNDNFTHPITQKLEKLALGFNPLSSKPDNTALDYIRGNLFDPTQMKPLPLSAPGSKHGPSQDLNDLFDLYIQRATNSDAVVYAFGQRFGPENIPDKIFHFQPGNGIHDIHMNQGNGGKFAKDNGVWQDGGLIINYPARKQWVGIFLAFQSQSFHTDDTTGNALGQQLIPTLPTGIRIVAALVNANSTVSLINTSPEKIDLSSWSLANSQKQKYPLDGVKIGAGELAKVPIQLSPEGDIITLLNDQGIKIDGVAYTKEQVDPNWTILF